jgi:hypothetical protein
LIISLMFPQVLSTSSSSLKYLNLLPSIFTEPILLISKQGISPL